MQCQRIRRVAVLVDGAEKSVRSLASDPLDKYVQASPQPAMA